ncbi:RES family NAD+ phosphorylase [Prescottella soli]|uniref:RES family NAD+ phosphorylase n=1 Tax=Prescottella soli TaxID=1543852 RepID=A0ABW9FNN1_9NOCA
MAAMLPPPPSIEWQPTEMTWRVHRTTGLHILPWSGLRTFGSILRFDHHPAPRNEHPDYGIWYGAASPRSALADAFQSARVIDRHRGDPYVTGLRFTRPLRLLDVSGIGGASWATRVGGNDALDSAPHSLAQHWARNIHLAHDTIDGIVYRGRVAGGTAVAVFERASDAFPARPELSLPLAHPALSDAIDTAAYQLGYTIT